MISTNKNKILTISSFSNSFIMTASRIEAMMERYLFKPVSLSAASFKILAFVNSNSNCSPSDILCYLGGTKSNITQRLNHLVKSKLICHLPSEGDKRKVLLCLSESGEKKLNEVTESFINNSVHFENFFTEKELHNHLLFMTKLNSHLNECEKTMKCSCSKVYKN